MHGHGTNTFTMIVDLLECAILGFGCIVPHLQAIEAAAEQVSVRKINSIKPGHRVADSACCAVPP